MADVTRKSGGIQIRPAADARQGTAEAGDLSPSVRLRFLDPALEGRRRVLVLMLGVPAGEFDRLLDLAERALDRRRDLPVFVVTTLDFAPLRERGALFELIPPASDLMAEDRDAYEEYARRRLALIRLKWEPVAEIDFGVPFELFLDDALSAILDPRS